MFYDVVLSSKSVGEIVKFDSQQSSLNYSALNCRNQYHITKNID